MRTIVRVSFVLVLGVAGCVADQAWGALRFDGIGPAKVGMSFPELNKQLHEKLSLPDEKEEQGCFYVKPANHDVSFMIEDGRLARIDVKKRGIATEAGIRVGDSEEKVLQTYGKGVKVDPHKYVDGGHYLTIHSVDRKYAVRFETEERKVVSFYAGTAEAIQYVEGCL